LGDILDQTIVKAIATVPRKKYRIPVNHEQPFLGIRLGGGCLSFHETTGWSCDLPSESHSPIFISSTDRSGRARVELLCSAITAS